MSATWVDRVIEGLWHPAGASPDATVYALLDAARDDRIYDLVRRSKLDYRCLYQGRQPPVLARAAPYIVSLGRGSRLTRQIVELGWGKSWGVFLRSPVILQDLRRHFLKLLRVRDETGRVFLFRFYDPRVLRRFLPTCTLPELRFLFGPVERFRLEGDDPDSLHELYLEQAVLRERRRRSDGWQVVPRKPQPLPIATAVATTIGLPHEIEMLTFRQRQLDAFQRDMTDSYEIRLAAHLERYFPERCRALGPDEVFETIRHGVRRAQGHGFVSERDICKYLNLMFTLGRDFDVDPRWPWAGRILDPESGRSTTLRINQLYAEALKQLESRP